MEGIWRLSVTRVGIELLGQLKNTKKSCNFFTAALKVYKHFSVSQELEQTREQVEVMYTGTDRLRSEYQRLCAGTRDLLASLRQQSISFRFTFSGPSSLRNLG